MRELDLKLVGTILSLKRDFFEGIFFSPQKIKWNFLYKGNKFGFKSSKGAFSRE